MVTSTDAQNKLPQRAQVGLRPECLRDESLREGHLLPAIARRGHPARPSLVEVRHQAGMPDALIVGRAGCRTTGHLISFARRLMSWRESLDRTTSTRLVRAAASMFDISNFENTLLVSETHEN
jgi:hypothetical protein